MSEKFKRTKEDFTCTNTDCGHKVKGTGYTNHCPKCLWGMHVDINPGDRAALCKGMMKPVGINTSGAEIRILHECISCGHEKWNKAAENDSREVIIELSQLGF